MSVIVPLDRSTPAWPTQLGWYAQKTRKTLPLGPDFMVQKMQFDLSQQEVYGEWERFVHTSGATYYYNETRNTYTGLNVRDCPSIRLEDFEAWVKAMQSRVNGDHTIVAEPARVQNVDGDIYLYYLVAPEAEVIGWLEPLDGTHLFRECDSAQQWNHKRLELEAQFWKHVEFFPQNFKLDRDCVRKSWTDLNWFHIYMLTLEHSTSATIFSNKEVMEKIINRLASLGSGGIIPEPGVAVFGRLYHMLRHRSRKWGPFPFIVTITMLCLPILVCERLDQIYVDGIVNSLDIKNFVDDFRSQNTTQIALTSLLYMAQPAFTALSSGVLQGQFPLSTDKFNLEVTAAELAFIEHALVGRSAIFTLSATILNLPWVAFGWSWDWNLSSDSEIGSSSEDEVYSSYATCHKVPSPTTNCNTIASSTGGIVFHESCSSDEEMGYDADNNCLIDNYKDDADDADADENYIDDIAADHDTNLEEDTTLNGYERRITSRRL
ncbi:hypothetical protein DFH29DRAFT_880850 [Suillus ampliporus]|nr:hypothetical protein DFH29DRAFT_880850 [Suillus ampliporus]